MLQKHEAVTPQASVRLILSKKAFHYRLSVVFNTIMIVKGTHNLKRAPI